MNNRKKRIIVLSLMLTLVTGLSSCKKKDVRLSITKESKEEALVGNLYKEDLKYYYIVESCNEKGLSVLCLVYDKYDNEELYTKHGEVVSILPFEYFVDKYSEKKEVYTAREIQEILDLINKDYDNLKQDANVRKLELRGDKIYGK